MVAPATVPFQARLHRRFHVRSDTRQGRPRRRRDRRRLHDRCSVHDRRMRGEGVHTAAGAVSTAGATRVLSPPGTSPRLHAIRIPLWRSSLPLIAGGRVDAGRDRVYAALRGGILGGRYGPGERLGEIEVADELALSRTPGPRGAAAAGVRGAGRGAPHRGPGCGPGPPTISTRPTSCVRCSRAWLRAARRHRVDPRQLAGWTRWPRTVAVDPWIGARPPGEFTELAALNAGSTP